MMGRPAAFADRISESERLGLANGKKIYVSGDTSTTEQMKKLADWELDALGIDGLMILSAGEELVVE